MDIQARLDTQDALQRFRSSTTATATNTTIDQVLIFPNKVKSIARRALACFALVCLVLAPLVLIRITIRTVWGIDIVWVKETGWGQDGKEHTTVHQARLSHRAFAPLEISYTHHLPLLNIPNASSSFQPLSFATVTVTSNDHLTLLHTLALNALPCAILDPSLSSAESPYDPTQIWYAFSAAKNASTALGSLDDYYDKLLPHYQQLLLSSFKSEQALRPAWFKGFLCTQMAWVKRCLGDTCLFKSDIERHTRSKAWVVTVKDGIERAKREKKDIAKKKVEVRKLEEDLVLFGTRIRKAGTIGHDDVKNWYFQNVARVGGQVWRDFDQEFGRLDCTIKDGAEVDSKAADEHLKELKEEEEGRWNVEEIWAR